MKRPIQLELDLQPTSVTVASATDRRAPESFGGSGLFVNQPDYADGSLLSDSRHNYVMRNGIAKEID
jgi:hypothetical protein